MKQGDPGLLSPARSCVSPTPNPNPNQCPSMAASQQTQPLLNWAYLSLASFGGIPIANSDSPKEMNEKIWHNFKDIVFTNTF